MKSLAVIALLVSTMASAQTPAPWERWHDLRSLADVGEPASSLLHSSYCQDGCRYDRTSVEPGRGGPRFLRYENVADGVEAVVFEDVGPGAITRLWMTMGFGVSERLDPAIRIRIYVDGAPAPVVDASLPDFFEGALPPFAPPMTHDRLRSSGGNVSYVPIAYRSHIKVSLLNAAQARLWFQFNHSRLPMAQAPNVEPFTAATRFAALNARLSEAGRSLWSGRYVWNAQQNAWAPPETAHADWLSGSRRSLVVADRNGAGWIDQIAVAVSPSHWPRLRVVLAIDGEITADVPLAEFFAADPLAAVPSRGLLAGVDERGSLYARLPMPHRHSAQLRIELAPTAGSASVQVHHEARTSSARPGPNAAPLRIAARSDCPTSTPDYRLFAHEGTGRIVGLVAYQTSDGTQPGAYFLEGDERLYIDGSIQPLWYGTGVEDLFNGGFYYDQGPFALPLHGSPARFGSDGGFASTAYRWFLTDAPAWRNRIDVRLESGAVGDEPFCARTVVYYYAAAHPTQARVASLDLSNPDSTAQAAYVAPAGAACALASGLFGDEPPTAADHRVCRFEHGASRFRFRLDVPGRVFRLRRTFDADADVAGQQAAEVFVNGTLAGTFAPVQRNPHRRWMQSDADLALSTPASTLDIEVRPIAGGLSEARYELFADVGSARATAREMAAAKPPRPE